MGKIKFPRVPPVRRDTVRKKQLEESTTRFDPLPEQPFESGIAIPPDGVRVAFLPDGQAAPGRPDDHWTWAGKYFADHQPEILLNIGDLFDLPSLSTHDAKGSLQAEGRRYQNDLGAGRRALDKFDNEIAKKSGYNPRKIVTLGNHCDRARRYVEQNPEMEGTLELPEEIFTENGWEVVPFLKPIIIGGVAFCHYFPSGVMGKPINSAMALISKMHMSCVAGHLQGRQVANDRRADGTTMTGLISGSFYQHDEHYMPPLNNVHFRGCWMLNELGNGEFMEMALTIRYLKRKFA